MQTLRADFNVEADKITFVNIMNNQRKDAVDVEAEREHLLQKIKITEKAKDIIHLQESATNASVKSFVRFQHFDGNNWVNFTLDDFVEEAAIFENFRLAWELNLKKRKIAIKSKTLQTLKYHADLKVQEATPAKDDRYQMSPPSDYSPIAYHGNASSSSSNTYVPATTSRSLKRMQPESTGANDTETDDERAIDA